MFDIGFSELVVIGVIALLVFGPEDLPRVARTVGHLLGKFRRYVADVKTEINREMENADLMRLQSEVKDSIQSLEESVNAQARSLEEEFQQVKESVSPLTADTEKESDLAVHQAIAVAQTTEASEIEAGSGEETADSVVDPNQLDLFAAPRVENSGSEKKGQ